MIQAQRKEGRQGEERGGEKVEMDDCGNHVSITLKHYEILNSLQNVSDVDQQ